jgi:phenylpropionate dioxygenase-like ring-hydroxylating dioxygenase large terminal subunit
MSSELLPGKILGTTFLDGRIVVFRGESGRVQALSAYCPHLGADLATGSVVGEAIRCAFHHWEYSQEGTCLKTGPGDPPPPGACLFRFPTAEKYGIIWVFNGKTPHFDLPDFPYPEDDLVFRVEAHEEVADDFEFERGAEQRSCRATRARSISPPRARTRAGACFAHRRGNAGRRGVRKRLRLLAGRVDLGAPGRRCWCSPAS